MRADLGSAARLTVADVLGLARQTSPAEVGRKAGRRVHNAVRSQVAVIELVKELDGAGAPPASTRLELQPIDAGRLPDLHELNRRRCATRKTRRFAADLERGDHGFVAYLGDEAVGYYWFADPEHAGSHRDLRRIRSGLELGPGEVYGYDLFILDEARGGNVASELLTLVEAALAARGHRRIWGYVEADNRPARWLYATRRYRATRRITTTTVLGYRSHQVSAA
jgi:GNAT superfamily N-acetyltransferase